MLLSSSVSKVQCCSCGPGRTRGCGWLGPPSRYLSYQPTAMSDASYIIRKCSYARYYLLFISLIIFFSLPTITIAVDVSHSTPTQCGPFQVIWNDSVLYPSLFILPLDDQPVNVDNRSIVHDTQTKTYNYTLNELPLKTGTKFVVTLDYHSGALFSSTLLYTNLI